MALDAAESLAILFVASSTAEEDLPYSSISAKARTNEPSGSLRHVHQIANNLFNVASNISNFGKLGGLYLDEWCSCQFG